MTLAKKQVRKVFPRLVELYDNTASLQDRTFGTGVLPDDKVAALVHAWGESHGDDGRQPSRQEAISSEDRRHDAALRGQLRW